MSVKAVTGSFFGFYNMDVPSGTQVEISNVIIRTNCISKKAFVISKCDKVPKLVGKEVCTSLILNPENIIAKLVKDIADAMKFGLHPYQWIASNRLGINYSDVTSEQKQKYKNMNFGELYGTIQRSTKDKFNRKLLLLL